MEESNKLYWIIDDAIIFKPTFNESLDDYSDIISNYRILIFSNYNDPYIAIKNGNMYNIKKIHLYVESSFNLSLDNSLLKLINLTQLTFGRNFNKPLGDSLSYLHNLRELTFGNEFNCPLGNSLSNLMNLRELTFGSHFNQPLDSSLSNLTNLRELAFGYYFNQSLDDCLSNLTNLRELTLGYNFNQSIDIPWWIKKLTLYCKSQSIIDHLPSSIVELELGHNFNLELNDLSSSIKKIIIRNAGYNKKLNNLPSGIEILEISSQYKIPIDRVYKNLNIVYLDKKN